MAKVKLEVESDYGPVVDTFNTINKNVDKTQENINEMGSGAKKAFKNATEEADKLGNEIKDTGKKVSDLKNETNKFGKEAGGMFSTLKNGIISVFGGNLLFSAINKVREQVTKVITLNIQLERSLKNLSAITGASGQDLIFYGEEAKKMGLKIQGGAVAAVEAFKLIGSAKPELLKNKEALVEVTNAALTLAQASGLTLPEAAANLGNTLNAFNAQASESAKYINVMAAAAQLGAKEIPFLTDALTKFGGVAKQSGVTIEESAAAIEILGAKIPQAEIVGNAMKGILINMQTEAARQRRPFAGLAEELEMLAPRVKDVTYLADKYRQENVLAIQTLIDQRKELKDLSVAVTGTNSAFEQAATNTDTMAQSLLEAGNAWDTFLQSLGRSKFVQNEVRGFIQGLTKDMIALSQIMSGTFFDTENIAAREIAQLNKLFVEGKLSLSEYSGQLKLFLSIAAKGKGGSSTKGGAGGSGASGDGTGADGPLGIIEQLQADIKSLTDKRSKTLLVSEIFSFNDQIKVKQAELDRLMGKVTKDLLKAQEDFDRALTELRKKANTESINAIAGPERIMLEKKYALEEIDLEEKKFIELGKIVNKNYKESKEQQDMFNVLRYGAESKAAKELINLEIEKQNGILEVKKKGDALNVEMLNELENASINKINGAPNRGVNPSVFEEMKQRRILDIQQKYAQERYSLKKKNLDAEFTLEQNALQLQLELLGNAQDSETTAKREKLQAEMVLLQKQFDLDGLKISNELKKIIDDILKQRERLNKKPTSFAELIGISQGELNALGSAVASLQSISNDIFAAKNRIVDQELQKNQELIASRENNIADLKSKLDQEYSLQEEGKANNIDRINQQIKEQEALREQDLANEKRIKAEKQKLAKQQLITDTVIQASNLAVAATNIYLQATAEAGPYGVAIGTAAVIAMVAAFAVQKIAAFKAINDQNGQNNFAEGVIDLKGPGTETSDSIRANLSKGESVMTAKETRRHKDLLLGIRNEDEQMMKQGILDLIRNNNIRLEDDLPQLLSRKRDMAQSGAINAFFGSNNSKVEQELAEMKLVLNKMLIEAKDKSYQDESGNLVKKFGSHTVTYRKK